MNSLRDCLSEKAFLSLSLFRNIKWIKNSTLLFSFNILCIALHSLLACMDFYKNPTVMLILILHIGKVYVFPSGFIQDFLLVFASLQSEYAMPMCGLCFCFVCFVFSFLLFSQLHSSMIQSLSLIF